MDFISAIKKARIISIEEKTRTIVYSYIEKGTAEISYDVSLEKDYTGSRCEIEAMFNKGNILEE